MNSKNLTACHYQKLFFVLWLFEMDANEKNSWIDTQYCRLIWIWCFRIMGNIVPLPSKISCQFGFGSESWE